MKKFFIKICKLLGYEILDQNNFSSPTLGKELNEELSILNEKSIVYEKNNFEPYAICLGKIESRKNQSKLKNIPCLFFAGPIADKNFSENNFNVDLLSYSYN